MKIDNSAAQLFQFCPDAYREKYVLGRQRGTTALDEGTEMHRLLKLHYSNQPITEPTSELEIDMRELLEAYRAHYPNDAEQFEVVETEKYFEVPLPTRVECDCAFWAPKVIETNVFKPVEMHRHYASECPHCKGSGFRPLHVYDGKWDMIVRMRDSGRLRIFETKTERRGSKANTVERWAVRDQAPRYIYAGKLVFGEEFEGVWLNVITKASPKKEKPPDFRRDFLPISAAQTDKSIADLEEVASQIEAMYKKYGPDRSWLQHREECVNAVTGWRCEFYPLHILGESTETLGLYKATEAYLIDNKGTNTLCIVQK